MQNLGEEFFFSKKIGIGTHPILSENVISDIKQSNIAVSVIMGVEDADLPLVTNLYEKLDCDRLSQIAEDNKSNNFYIEKSGILSGIIKGGD